MYVIKSITLLYPQGKYEMCIIFYMELADILKQWEPQVARSNRASILQDIISLYRTELYRL